MNVNVCFTPQDYIRHNFFADHTAVVIDVFRASTTIITALANGCGELIPVETVEKAVEMKKKRQEALLGGERQAVRIPGFDLGNSPFEYSRPVVEGRTIITSTTNGTSALKTAEEAVKVFVGGFVNAQALVSILKEDRKDVVLLCAGNYGRFSLEDALCAGLFAKRLSGLARVGDAAMAAKAMYCDFSGSDFTKKVAESSHASFLIKAGFEKDVAFCLQCDLFSITPEFCDGVITI